MATQARVAGVGVFVLGGSLLFAGDICNTNIYDPADRASHKAVRAMFETCEVCGWDPTLAATAEGVPPPIR